MKHLKILLLFIIAIGINHTQAQIDILKDSALGNYSVSFKHETIIDYSRSFGNLHRPVELFIWYPSNEKKKTPFNYTEYIALNKKIRNSKDIDSVLLQVIDRSGLSENKEELLKKFKFLKTSAHKNTTIVNGSFPLILFAPGGTTPGYLHSVLCEYLASYGYVVAALPALGNDESSRWPFNQTGLNLQLDDMAFAINNLKLIIPQVDIDKICLTSWSVGGVSQAIYAMKNSNIDMFVSLDSGIGRTYGIEMLKASPYFDYKKLNIPYLHYTGTQPEQYVVERSSELYDSIPSVKKYSLIIEPFAHQHFTTQNGLINDLISETSNNELSKAYLNMCYTTRVFVDAFLKEDPDSKTEWLDLIKTK